MKNIDTKEQLNIVWLRAAILGSVWASCEIILGSFLHNLKIPFSGTFLSAIAVYLLVSFDEKWKTNGVIWRAGIICALMKSISPSAVVFGPMIAITAESFLLSISISTFGRNYLGYAIGGSLAVTWSLFHKVINMIILYGVDIITIYKNLYLYAVKTTSISVGTPIDLVIILVLVYITIGIIASLLGRAAGKKAVKLVLSINENFTEIGRKLDLREPFERHSIPWIFIELVFMTSGLLLLSYLDIFWGFFFVIAITSINIFRYEDQLLKDFKPKFWIKLTIVTTLAGFLMGGVKDFGWIFSIDSIVIGFQITLRALLLTECFAILGIELANPKIKLFFSRLKLGKLPQALEAAFRVLPIMVATLSSHKDKFRTPSILVSGFITIADEHIKSITGNFDLDEK